MFFFSFRRPKIELKFTPFDIEFNRQPITTKSLLREEMPTPMSYKFCDNEVYYYVNLHFVFFSNRPVFLDIKSTFEKHNLFFNSVKANHPPRPSYTPG